MIEKAKPFAGPWWLGCFILILAGLFSSSSVLRAETKKPGVKLQSLADKKEVERIIAQALQLPVMRRVEFVSKYLIGRKYRRETKDRIKKQQTKKVEKHEATNLEPIPVKFLQTSIRYLDCMTYVEHVLAMAACKKASYETEFIDRLTDIMFDADGEQTLMNHHRSHFTSHWGDINEQKGYLDNFARNHPEAKMRELTLNKVGSNRTFYVEDRFMIAKTPQQVWYFPIPAVLDGKVKMVSGDIVALVTDKEGLDVTHMGFYIEHNRKRWLRHASFKLNKIVDQNFDQYLRDGSHIKGLMVFRPSYKPISPSRCLACPASR